MFIMKKILFQIIVLLTFISCEKDVTLEFNNMPKLCFNCILNPDSIITASLTFIACFRLFRQI